MGVNIMLALGSMVMFATFLGSSNKVILGNNQIATQNEYYIAALSYGQSVIDEAKTKAFYGTITTGSGPLAVKTRSLLLGTENSGERIAYADTLTAAGYASEAKFDDVDDYDGYLRRVNSPRAEGYMISTAVRWVNETAPSTVSTTPTLSKRMMVYVTSPYFPRVERNGSSYPDTLKLSYVFSD